ncbi:MAG: hypothetical protein AVDCRST_MAG61-510, partial [uncultured Friedmanniella sp.]
WGAAVQRQSRPRWPGSSSTVRSTRTSVRWRLSSEDRKVTRCLPPTPTWPSRRATSRSTRPTAPTRTCGSPA